MKELLQKIGNAGLIIDIVEGKLKVYSDGNNVDPEILNAIKTKKDEITIYLIQNNVGEIYENKYEKISPAPLDEFYPISDAQRRLWVLSQFEESSVAYNMPGSTYLYRDIDIENFKRAIESTIERHEILRTVFKEDKSGEIRQWILKREGLGFKIDYKDYRKEKNKDEKVKEYITADSYKAFDLEQGPLLRAGLLQVEDEEYIFYYNMHHIISDGWSMEVLSKDVMSYYDSYKENKEPSLKPLRIQYKDYSAWQLSQLEKESFKAHRAYWLNNLKGELPLLDLPGTKQRPRVKTHDGRTLRTYLNKKLSQKLKRYSEINGGTVFMGLLAAWNVLMCRYTSQADIIIGTPIAGREHADLEDQIGFYINTLALRNAINPEENFDELFSRVKHSTLNAYSHQMYPFDRLVEELNLIRDTSRSAVFDILLDFHNTGEKIKNIELGKAETDSIVDAGKQLVKYDLELHFTEVGDYILIQVNYNEDVYEKQVIEGVIAHYKRLMVELIDNSTESVGGINFLSKQEKNQLILEFNDTKVDYPKEKTILDLFEEQVGKTPDAAVIRNGDKALSYKELDELSNQFAHCLIKNCQVKASDIVGIKLDKGDWSVISILGVLKTGAGYVPIDPEYPSLRKQHILSESKIKLLITDTNYLFDNDEFDGSVFAVDVEFDKEVHSKERVNLIQSSASLAYVIYTSGSTGNPKGVMIDHASLMNYLIWARSAYRHTSLAGLDFGLFSSLSFDLTVTSLYLPLISGGALTVFDSSSDILSVLKTYFESDISCIKLTPAHISLLKSLEIEKTQVQTVIVGGDKLENTQVEILKKLNPAMRIYNEYGPTESTVGCIVKKIVSEKEDILIGKPISNTQIYILSPEGSVQPVGVIGEICVGGAGLARGYLNQEELTGQKFIENPFKEGERIYKTGDLGRWLPDGNIEFIGRKDDQVKIRGYRIELGEIEHALLKNEKIKEAVVIVKANENKEKELVAYITSKEEQNTSELRSYLKELVPEYMVPGYFVQLGSMPLTSNGKVDKRSLPDPQGLGLKSGVEYVGPGTEQEKVLSEVWSDVLKREGIGIKDSFYNLGGDSIKSIQVVSRLKQKGYTLKVEHILRTPVLEELSPLMQYTTQVIDQREVKGEVELTPIQKWFFESSEIKVYSHFNQSVLLLSKHQIAPQVLEKSIAELTRHHDALRMVYKKTDQGWTQLNQDATSKSYTLDYYDLREADNAHEQMSQIGESLQSSISLEEGPLFRVVHFRLKDGDRLGLIIQHLVVDGVSWRILLEDLSSFYTSYQEGKKVQLPLKTDSFQRWALLQKEYAQNKKMKRERAYWEEVCAQEIENLPQDNTVAETDQVIIDASESFSLDKQITELLQTRAHRVYNTEINDVLLTGLGLAIKEVLSRDKSVLKMEGHGREEIIERVDISRTVGWFTTMYPFVLDVSKSSGTESLVEVKEALRKVPSKGIGYGILKHLSQEGIESKINPEIVFNYLGDFGTDASGSGESSLFDYASESIGSNISPANVNDAILDVSGMLVMGELRMTMSYSKSRYDSGTIQKLIKSYEKNLKNLIEELSSKKDTYLTPSDLSFKGLSVEELSKINSDGNVKDVYGLSPLQEGIYYHWQAEDSSTLYFEQMSYRIRAKELDIKKLKRAYDKLVARHGVLRTSFSTDYAGRSLQIVRKEVPSNFTYEKLEDQKDMQDKQNYVEEVRKKDRDRGFDLSAPSQMRLHIIDLGEGEYEFIWSHHHILMDGWCMSVLVDDFNQLVSSETMGKTLDLSPVMPYSNYINWLTKIDKESSLGYWKDYLSGYSQVAEIPFKINTEEKSYVESREYLQIEEYLFRKVDALCNKIGITHNTFIQGVWGYLLSLYNNTNDVVFGAVASGRPAELEGVEDMIGLFINTIPIRVRYKPTDSPVELLKALQEQSIESASHHYMNLSEVQSQSELGMNLINHIMVFENYVVKELTGEGVLNTQREEGLSVESMEVFERTNYDFSITIGTSSTSLNINYIYNVSRYDSLSLKRLKDHFDNLISEFTAKADQPLHTINYLSEAEKHELLITFNSTTVDYPQDKTIVDLFEEQVTKTPNNVAVVFEEKELTYKQLDELSNQLARYLRKNYDIKPDDLVGIKLDRSEWMVVSILGVLKSGGAYVPIDPEYPQERIDYIEQDTKCKVWIDEKELEKFQESQADYSTAKVDSPARIDNLAYVMYTSGSTGQPKGVMIEHRSVVRLVKNTNIYSFSSGDTLLSTGAISFDATTFEYWGPLLNGAELILCSQKMLLDSKLLHEKIKSRSVNIMWFTSGWLNQLIESEIGIFNDLKTILAGGDKLTPGHIGKLRRNYPGLQIINGYGPTENTTFSNTYTILEIDGNIPIGKPINNSTAYILSKHNSLLPTGVIGEICVGGMGLSRGYLNQPDLTKEKFIKNPFKAGERMYKTGDLGRWLADGNIEFIGRKDDQVKIRGYRIELGEIEHALLRNKKIKEAVVIVKANENKEKELVAYITSKEEQNTSELRSYLKELVPEYMVPGYFVQLGSMPLTSNGKVDKRSLPDPQGLGLKSGVEYVGPGTEQEKVLSEVWSDVLKREGIGIKDSFYNLGGDSIKSIQVVSRLKQKGYTLKVEHILRTPVLEELSPLMQYTTQVIDQREVKGEVELTPIQKWFFESSEIKVYSHFNQSVLLLSKHQIAPQVLEKSIAELTRHHDALRMVYKKTDQGWTQLNQDATSKSYTLDYYDLREADNAHEQMSQIGESLQSSISLEEGPLFRVVHFRLKDGDRLGLIIQHLVVDGVSWRILLEDLSSLYTSYQEGKKVQLPLKTDSFQRWALLQKEYAQNKKMKRERAYWEEVCAQEIENLPQDNTVAETDQVIIDASESFNLDKQITELLQTRAHRVYNTEINDVLLTGLGLAIKEVLSRDKSVLKMEGHGREEIIERVDISRTVGWFTTMYPFVLDVSKSSGTESLVEVKEALRQVSNKGIGYGILNYLDKTFQTKIHPEIVFNYLGDFGTYAGGLSNSAPLFEYSSEHIGPEGAKENGSNAILDVSGMLVMGELSMSVRYSKSRYNSTTIKKLIKSYEKNLKNLIEELSSKKETYLTPSDLSFKGLSVEELSKINSDGNVEDVYGLSPLQEGIYYHWQAEDSSTLYFEQMSYRIRAKELDIKKLKRAYDKLVARHGVLRTSFSTDYAGRSLQIVRKEVPINFTYEKLEDQKDMQDKQNYVEEVRKKDRDRGFDLSAPSQMRLHITDLGEGEYEFIWSFHHILMDGWCMSVLINDFNELLSAEAMGKTLDLPQVLPYSNYINWLTKIDEESSLGYWKDYLSGYSQVVEIPFKINTEEKSYVESREYLQIGEDLFRKVDALCNKIGITHNTFIQGVWGYLLSLYNNTNDVVFGAVASGRPAELEGVEDMIGLFINTIPIRVRYKPTDSPVELLKALQEQSIESASHHYMNLSEVQSQSELGMNLINHIIQFQNYAVKELNNERVLTTQREEGLSVESMEVFERNNYDLTIIISPSTTSLNIDIKYNVNRYDSLSLKRLKDHFDNLISEFTAKADQPLHTINYLSEAEKHELLITFNSTIVDYPQDKTIVDLFEEQVTKTPDNVAVVFEGKELTYRELDERSNQLANLLRENYDVAAEDLVGIQLNRSEWIIISILGILKSGGAYVPIDPEYPVARKQYIIEDASLKLLITEANFVLDIDYYKGNIFAIDVEFDASAYSSSSLEATTTSNNLAYIMYTSGSTGKPKGVMVEQKSVVRLVKNTNIYSFSQSDKLLSTGAISFDATTFEFWGPLLNGGQLVLCSQRILLDNKLLNEEIKNRSINIMWFTSGLLNQLVESEIRIFSELNTVLAGGDKLSPSHIEKLRKSYPELDIINGYGPTENTTFSITHKISEVTGDIPIGQPISNTQVYLLNEVEALQPIGVIGEICVGGEGLARGYLNQVELTKEKFIANPFKEGERLYKTGDLGRWLAGGNIAFIGRKDDQLKIRGYRIELSEIEHVLQSHEDIQEAVVVAKENEQDQKELVAYITSKSEQNISALRNYLKDFLPQYMLPAYYVQVASLPFTANGKIDKRALPDPQGMGLSSGVEYVAPRNEVEAKLVRIWQEILQRDNIGVKDDFFALGGHSLKAVRVISKIQKEFNIKFELAKVFEITTVEKVAELISITSLNYFSPESEMEKFNI